MVFLYNYVTNPPLHVCNVTKFNKKEIVQFHDILEYEKQSNDCRIK